MKADHMTTPHLEIERTDYLIVGTGTEREGRSHFGPLKVFLDDACVGRLRRGQVLRVEAQAGEHILRVRHTWVSSKPLPVTLRKGETLQCCCSPTGIAPTIYSSTFRRDQWLAIKVRSQFDGLVARYIASWNETEPTARRIAIDDLWAEDGRYTDPLVDVQGREEIDAAVSAVQERSPKFHLRLVGPVDGHHDQCRFSWQLGPPEGHPGATGCSVAVVDSDRRLHRVLGFLDQVP